MLKRRCHLNVIERFYVILGGEHWFGLPREAGEPPALEMLKAQPGTAPTPAPACRGPWFCNSVKTALRIPPTLENPKLSIMCLVSDSKHLTNIQLNPFSQLALNPAGAHLANITLSIST